MALNKVAQLFKSLHKPGNPVVLANVYDRLSAKAVASLPSSKALATASYAIAVAAGTTDDDLQLETNLAAVRSIAPVAKEFQKPLSVDIQDAYGNQLEEAISSLIDLGVVGVNLEDIDKETQKAYSPDEAAERVRKVLEVGRQKGVPDFVVNARCDTLVNGGTLDETISRGKKYLAAGATTVFVWGGSKRGLSREEVETLIKEFDGRLSVMLKMNSNGLTVSQLKDIGVARISVGPQIQIMAMAAFAKEAEKILSTL